MSLCRPLVLTVLAVTRELLPGSLGLPCALELARPLELGCPLVLGSGELLPGAGELP